MSSSLPPDQVVNKRVLARHLRTSVVSLGNWIERWSDFPVLERGTNGREWQFSVQAVVEFLRAKQEAGRAAQAERDEALAQLTLPLAHVADVDRSTAGVSHKDQLQALDLRIKLRKEAVELQRLVSADEIRDALATAFGTMGRTMTSAIKTIARDLGLPPTAVRALQTRMAEAQRSSVREIAKHLAGADVTAVDVERDLEQEEERVLA